MNSITYPRDIRFRWYRQVEKYGKPVKEVCSIFGISRKTYYKWYTLDHGGSGVSYQPKKVQPNTKLTHEIKRMIEKEKLKTNYGPLKMKLLLKRRLGASLSTTVIYRYYKRQGLVRRPQKRLSWYQSLKDPVIPKKPGDVVQIDTKYVWVRGMRKYQRTFLDVYTSFQHAVIVDSLGSQETVTALEEAERVFPFPILGTQSDNGPENCGIFHQYLGERGIAHYFIPKSSPNWDGAVERAHGVIDQEYYLNPMCPWKNLSEYLHWYNHERIHLGKYLNGLIPMEKVNQYFKNQEVLPLTVN